MTLMFFHGLESGPHGSKYQSLTTLGPVDSPDFQGMDLQERLDKAEAHTRPMHDIVLVGSSFGGLLAARLYSLHPDRFKALVLLAPALHFREETDQIERLPSPERIVVIHGTRDDVVPLEPVQAFCNGFDIDVTVVDDEHRLAASHDLMLQAAQRFLTP